jgi:hypothetical protein
MSQKCVKIQDTDTTKARVNEKVIYHFDPESFGQQMIYLSFTTLEDKITSVGER